MRRLRAPLLTALLLAVAAGGGTLAAPFSPAPPPFTSSAYYSVGKVSDLPTDRVLDVTEPADLAAVIQARAFRGHLLYFQFESTRNRWLDFAVNAVHQLTAVGYHHYVALGGWPIDCERLQARWAEVGPTGSPAAACVYASRPEHGTLGQVNLHGFWAARYGFLQDLVAANVSALLFDADTALAGDIFAALEAPCLANATVVAHAEGGGPNTGFFYVRAGPGRAHPDGAAHWLVAQVRRRLELFYAAKEGSTHQLPGSPWEQDVMKDALRVALNPNNTAGHWDMWSSYEHKEHSFWAAHPQTEPSAYKHSGVSVEALECGGFEAACAAAYGERFCNSYGLSSRPLGMEVLHKPADAPGVKSGELPPELFVYAPAYAICFGGLADVGWPPPPARPLAAFTHLLGVRGVWRRSAADAQAQQTHVGRLLAMQAHGFWAAEMYRNASAQRRLLFLAQEVVDAAARAPSIAPLRALLRHALALAAAHARVLVVPSIPCDAPWIGTFNASAGEPAPGASIRNVSDARLIIAGPLSNPTCWPGAHSYEFCWPWQHLTHGFDALAAARRPGAALRSTPAAAADDEDVVIAHVPHALDAAALGEAAAERIRTMVRDCPDYACETGGRDCVSDFFIE